MSDPNADFKTLLDLTGGVQVRSAEHPDDRRQRHRLEVNAIRLIGAIAAFSALILVLSFFRPVPEKRADWAAGVLQLVLGGAVGFALYPKARAAVALLLNNGAGAIVRGNPAVVVGER